MVVISLDVSISLVMKGSRLLRVLAFFQTLSDPGQREIDRVVDASLEAQNVLGGRVRRNTLSNALRHREFEHIYRISDGKLDM
jgi:hypothetical protein